MTADGQCWELPTLEHRISGTGSGCVPNGETFWHTPNTNGLDGGSNSRKAIQQRQWRTPTAHEWKNTGHATQIHLSDQVRPSQVKNPKKAAAMWPTPVATDYLWNNSERLESWQARADKKKAQGVNLQFALRHAVQKWPTPTVCGNYNRKGASATSGDGLATAVYQTSVARMWKDNGKNPSELERNSPTLAMQAGGALNPTWVEWLMGWPLGWTDLKPLATDKSHCAQPQRGDC
jgi:hypothetical protein